MADQEEEDLRMALRMSMQQHSLPEPKRSKPMDVPIGVLTDSTEESMEVKTRRTQRELMAAAAEKRMLASKSASETGSSLKAEHKDGELSVEGVNLGRQLSEKEANQLFTMVFGSEISRDVLAQWSNQGIRFSPDPETSMGLVQHEGGPCGVLAAIQAYVIKYLLFFPEELKNVAPTPSIQKSYGRERTPKSQGAATNDFTSLTEDAKTRALVRSMSEILFVCGNNERAVVATLSVIDHACEGSENGNKEDIISKALGGLSVDSAAALQKVLRVNTYKSQAIAFRRIQELIPIFQSRMGALLFLISALLSRGLDMVQGDRDDPSLPLVTAPFGHASQEIVNLLVCGQAVPNVFDGRMDLGGGMCLRGISTSVEVGFLTLLESLNFCKVGQHLKCPKWPIWVVGSESHYTVLFALDSTVQDENELEERESQIRKAFDAQDQSGGGGFISIEGFRQVLKDTAIKLPSEKFDHLCSTSFIVWSEFWQVILELDKSLGGLKDSTGLMGKKVFDLYHFNGIAKSDLNGSQSTIGGDSPIQRPRLTILKVSVPPRWTPEEFMADVAASSASGGNGSIEKTIQTAKSEPPQHAPLVDCIRTRWPRAVCNWVGHPPSIV